MKSILTTGDCLEEDHRSTTAEPLGNGLIDQATKRDLIAVSPWLACREDLDCYAQNDHSVPAEHCIGRWEDDGGRAYEIRPGEVLGV